MKKIPLKLIILVIVVLSALACLTYLCAAARLDGTQFLTGFGIVLTLFAGAVIKDKPNEESPAAPVADMVKAVTP